MKEPDEEKKRLLKIKQPHHIVKVSIFYLKTACAAANLAIGTR